MQLVQDSTVRLLQEPGRKLVQQAPDIFGCLDEDARLLGTGTAEQLHVLQRLLQGTGDLGQSGKSNGRRTAAEGMRQGDNRIRHRAVQLHGPLAGFGQQPPRPLVGLVQIDVVQRNGDVQRPYDPHLLVGRRLCCLQRHCGRFGIGCCAGLYGLRQQRWRGHGPGLGTCQGDEIELFEAKRCRLAGARGRLGSVIEGAGGLEIRMCIDVGGERPLEHLRTLKFRMFVLRLGLGLGLPHCKHRRGHGSRRRHPGRRARNDRHFLARRRHRLWRRDHLWLRGGARNQQRQALAVQTQAIGSLAEGQRTPVSVNTRGDIFDPAPEALDGIARQADQVRARRLLLGQPGVEQLLHGPGGLAKLAQADHPRTALERVEGAPQYRLFAEVARLVDERRDSPKPRLDHFSGFFQEDLAQLGVFGIEHYRGAAASWRRLRRDCGNRRDHRLCRWRHRGQGRCLGRPVLRR